MASLFDIIFTARPGRTIKSQEHNALQQGIKASLNKLGEEAPVGLKGVSTPFAVGNATDPLHAINLSQITGVETAVGASAAAAAASASQASGYAADAATQVTLAGNQVLLAAGQVSLATTQKNLATGQAQAAATSSGNALASATTAAGHVTTALGHANAAAASATAADEAADAAYAAQLAAEAAAGGNLALGSISDVTISSVANGELLMYSAGNWINRTLAEVGVQPASAVLTNTTASFLTAHATKLGNITVTASVNLDTLASDTATNNAKVSNATHTGDVTGSGALTIAANAVTLSKMADMATASLIGRTTTGTGDPEILSASAVKSMLTLNLVDNTPDSGKPVSTAQQTAINLKANAASPTFTGAVTEGTGTITSALTAANGSIVTRTASGNITFTDGLSDGQGITLILTNGGSYAISWPTMTWFTAVGNIAPELTALDSISLFKVGSTLYGIWLGSGV